MSYGISAPFIRYPIGTSLMMAGILFVGLVAYPLLPVAPLPQVDFPTIQITANLPGGSPETMATSVAQPLERQFAQIPGVAQMTSTSYLGTSAVTIQFDLNRSIDGAANDVQAAINAASGQLPKNLPSPPTYRKVNPADSPILLLSATSDSLPLTTVSDAVDAQLAQQISQISGVGQVVIGGQQKPSIRVQVDPAKLVAKGLSLEDVRAQISIATVDSPKGNIDGDTRAYTIYANDQLTASKDWNDVIIAYRNGGPLRVRDIGQAVTGPEDAKQAAWANGKRGVFLVVYKQPGANVIDTVDKIKATLPRLVAAIPPAIKIELISDLNPDDPRGRRGRAIHAAPDHRAGRNGHLHLPAQLLGDGDPDRDRAGLALLVRLRADVGVRLYAGQPVADGADDFGRLRGRRRHRDAGEHHALYRGRRKADGRRLEGRQRDRIYHRVDQRLAGRGADPAVVDGGHHRPPVPRIRGDAGHDDLRLDDRIADADADDGLALPARARRNQARRLDQWSERAFDAMLHGYERGLYRALRWKFATLMIFFATLGLSVYLFVVIPKGFFPQQDNGLITATSEANQDISFADMKRKQEALGQIVMADPDVASVAMAFGGSGRAGNNGNLFDHAEAAQPAESQRAADHRPSASQAGEGRRRPPVHAGRAGRPARRLARPARSSSSRCRTPIWPS